MQSKKASSGSRDNAASVQAVPAAEAAAGGAPVAMSAPRPPAAKPIDVSGVFGSLRSAFWGIGVVSLLINVLMLTGPLFMLQVYDRVLASGSVPTLIVIGGLALSMYVFYGLLEGVRGRILARVGQRVDAQLSGIAYAISTVLPLRMGAQAAKHRPVQDLDTLRQFLSGPGPAAIFDVPWIPLYLGVVFLFHPMLGFLGLGGALVICVLIGLNEMFSRKPAAEAAQVAGRRNSVVEVSRRNAEAVQSMGMMGAMLSRWTSENDAYLAKQRSSSDLTGFFGTATKTIRFLLQSAILGVGAWLAIRQEITPGVMIAASIMTSRALSPVEQAVSQWRGFVAARQGLGRLKALIAADNKTGGDEMLDLPLPKAGLRLEELACGPAGLRQAFVQGVTLDLVAGDGLGVIGPSGSGKSTLARAIVGLTPALKGAVRFDGAELTQWSDHRIGDIIGYLPQDVQLFDGTIAENISRFALEPNPDVIIDAAKLADVHDLIVGLPEGYNTLIGSEGMAMSGGQRQRIALARALYGRPFLVVLDEPNSNLDSDGEAALTGAIKSMRAHGSIVVVIAHRPSAIVAVDKVLCLSEGKVAGFGPKDEVMQKLVAPVPSRGGVAAHA
ncbi:type I secretion system permease/ATPase [uncultured Hoeflea sp.]|uniref:type I secretion system permease/ATPase n=1 Tax=uncultured Hoeflea sp. TaxID=538666 RepID=UPI0030D756CF